MMGDTETDKPVLSLPREVHLVGVGGTGSWVLPCLVRLARGQRVELHVWDGDRLESKNLDRQLFSVDEIGKNKAAALVAKIVKEGDGSVSVLAHDEYFHAGSSVGDCSLLISCADNHVARRACLQSADMHQGYAIIAGNEFIDAEAYYYDCAWRETKLDPRVFAPELETDRSNDPRAPVGCTGTAQLVTPQLVIANMTSADFVMRLLWTWFATARQSVWTDEDRQFFPVALYASFLKTWTVTKAMAERGERQ